MKKRLQQKILKVLTGCIILDNKYIVCARKRNELVGHFLLEKLSKFAKKKFLRVNELSSTVENLL